MVPTSFVKVESHGCLFYHSESKHVHGATNNHNDAKQADKDASFPSVLLQVGFGESQTVEFLDIIRVQLPTYRTQGILGLFDGSASHKREDIVTYAPVEGNLSHGLFVFHCHVTNADPERLNVIPL